MRRIVVPVASCLAALVALQVTSAFAAGAAVNEPNATDARAAFNEATALVKKAQWAEALAAFERAGKLSPHAITTFNIAACERAMGRYTRARIAFERALAEDQASHSLSDSLREEARAYLGEIDRLLVRVELSLKPAPVHVAIDGRPLFKNGDIYVAGIHPPGPPEAAPEGAVQVSMDPGSHVFAFSRPGFSDAIVNKTFAPGTSTALHLQLDRLPATLHVASNRAGAVVSVDGLDVGPAPVDVVRFAGSHKVLVRKTGFVTYEAEVNVRPGEKFDLNAPLAEQKPAITERWWFWTAAGVVVVGAAATTYLLTRPDPQRPEVNGGSLGWKVAVP